MAVGYMDGDEILELSHYNPQCGFQADAASTQAQYVATINDSIFDTITGGDEGGNLIPIKRPAGKRIAYAIFSDYMGTILAAQYIEVLES